MRRSRLGNDRVAKRSSIEESRAPVSLDAPTALSRHRLADDLPLFSIGSFDSRVTVLSQQTRALNLAWSLIETQTLPVGDDGNRCKVAVVGAGFAGLSFAAGLLRKGAACDLFLFEQRDTLLPLQQGSDTRWLHPHIYDWPAAGSEASAAMLPVLNWTAARSSDVVVQVLGEWKQIARGQETLRLFCNSRHLQIAECQDEAGKARLEWVGEERTPEDGTALEPGGRTIGSAETFDIVVLAVGFGLEAGKASYWRNETFGQPSLNEPRRTFLLSGQGDGAMIDLMRIRVSQFRQDRILDELFGDRPGLVAELQSLRSEFDRDEKGLFEKFERVTAPGSPYEEDMKLVMERLDRRLRRDTDVVLQLLVRNISELLEPSTSRMSFQNALLVFLLYRCGGFAPTTETVRAIRQRFSISADSVVERHGVRPLDQLQRMLPEQVFKDIEKRRKKEPEAYGVQPARSFWPGGYFGYRGREADTATIADDQRRQWRKEYLPGPTALVATTLCGALAGAIERLRPDVAHFRLTLHRTISIHDEELLQQCCDYLGRGLEDATATAGRTFPAAAATIGAAYRCRRIVRTTRQIDEERLKEDMMRLKLHEAAREMLPGVGFVLAIPLVQPDELHFAPSPVTAVLYFDSRDVGFWLDDEEIEELRTIFQTAGRSMSSFQAASLGRIRNFPLEPILQAPRTRVASSTGATALEIVPNIDPPSTTAAFVLNFDHTDLSPVTTDSTTQNMTTAAKDIHA